MLKFICAAFLLVLVTGFSNRVFAQHSIHVTGTITNGSKPLEMATVYAYSGTDTTHLLSTTTTDSTGSFQLVIAVPVLLLVQYIGYTPLRLMVSNVPAGNQLGVLVMQPASGNLGNIVVTASKKLVVKTPNGLVINAAESLTQAGGTVTDLLAASPMVLVDGEGAITLRGKTPQILINGRNSALAGSLDKLPASSVERIEIINQPSAANDAESEAGIINIVLKKNLSRGNTGAISGSAGAGAKARVSSSVLLNSESHGWELGLGYDNRFAGRDRYINASRETFASFNQHLLTQRRDDDRMEKSQNFRLSAEKNFANKSSLSLEGVYEYSYQRNDESLQSFFRQANNKFENGNLRFSHEIPVEHTAELAGTYSKMLGSRGAKMITSLSHSFEAATEKTHISTTPLNEFGAFIGNAYLQQTRNLEKNNISNLRTDFSFPVKQHGIFETGYKGTVRLFHTSFASGPDVNGVLVPNAAASNLFDYQEQVQAAYAQYKQQVKPAKNAFAWEAGLRAEYTGNKGVSQGKTNFTHSYLRLFPNAGATYYLGKDQWLRASYARRINRPGLGALNPFVDITDSLNPHSGNPSLQPEMVHNTELGYNYGWGRGSASVNLYYRNATNTILPLTTIDSNGVALSRPQNFGRANTAGIEWMVSANPAKPVSLNASFSLYHQQITGDYGSEHYDQGQWSWYTKAVCNLNLWKGNKWQWLFNYQAPTAIPQGRRIAQYNLDMAISQSCLKGKGRFGLTATDIFNTRKSGNLLSTAQFVSSRIAKADTRAVLLTFGYTFGAAFKEKVMSNQFNIE